MILSLLKWFLILALCLIGAFYLTFSTRYVDEVTYKGTSIKIERDDYGVATIHAFSVEDYLYGLGTILAEDRLFQVTFRAYSAQGRLA
jgi:acyl-homoserine lactone acylase PvdQ